MTKTELESAVKKLQSEKNVSPVDAVFEVIKEQVQQGNKVSIRGFGTFSLKVRKAGVIRNPRTGEMAECTEKQKPVFKGSWL